MGFKRIFPGMAVSVLAAMTAQFLSDHYGAPAMLMALLLGLALNFLAEEGTRTLPGVEYSAKTILRLGVAPAGVFHEFDRLFEGQVCEDRHG